MIHAHYYNPHKKVSQHDEQKSVIYNNYRVPILCDIYCNSIYYTRNSGI